MCVLSVAVVGLPDGFVGLKVAREHNTLLVCALSEKPKSRESRLHYVDNPMRATKPERSV